MENELVQKLKIKDLKIKKFQDLNNVVMGLSLIRKLPSQPIDTITHLNNNLLSSMAQVNNSNYS